MGSVGQFIRWFELIGRHCWGGGLSGTRVLDMRSIRMVYISVQSFARSVSRS